MNIQQLEEKLEKVEKEIKEAEIEEEFMWALREYKGEDEVISFSRYKKILEGQVENLGKVMTNIPKLDSLIDGFQGGELVIITGPTGGGKTTLGQTLTRNFSNNGIKSLWFSYEVSARQFLAKFGENMPLGFMPKNLTDRKLVWIERKIVEAIAKFETKTVIIDHLHYLLDISQLRNASLEIGGMVREIKQMAIKYGVVIFLIAHMTKTRVEERIGLEDIRDSSFVSQESDYVLAIWRLTEKQKKSEIRDQGVKYKDEAIISVEKNRKSGRLGSVNVVLKDNIFYEKADDVYAPTSEVADEDL